MLFEAARDELVSFFKERDKIIDALFIALVGRLHLLMIGPPGTAKSALLNAVGKMSGLTVFRHLMTKFTTPEELFGPFSLAGLENDEYYRIADGKLPTADTVFLDEIFKANSAILNALLTAMEERYFDNGPHSKKIPLITLVGASNEPPEDQVATAALYDRFHFRFWVGPVHDDSFLDVIMSQDPTWKRGLIDAGELLAAQLLVPVIEIPVEVGEALRQVRRDLRNEGIPMSDRRARQILRSVMPASAVVNERDKVTDEDAFLLPFVLAEKEGDLRKTSEIVYKYFACSKIEAEKKLDAFLETLDEFFTETSQNPQAVTIEAAGKMLDRGKRLITELDELDTAKAAVLRKRLQGINSFLHERYHISLPFGGNWDDQAKPTDGKSLIEKYRSVTRGEVQ